MKISLVSDELPEMEYHLNPCGIIGAYEAMQLMDDGTAKGTGTYYVDTANGRDFRISRDSYYAIIGWMHEKGRC